MFSYIWSSRLYDMLKIILSFTYVDDIKILTLILHLTWTFTCVEIKIISLVLNLTMLVFRYNEIIIYSTMYNHNYDFSTWVTIYIDTQTSILVEYWDILSRDPRNLTPGRRWYKSPKVPFAKSLHSCFMDGKAPSSTNVKNIVVDSFTIISSSMDHLW